MICSLSSNKIKSNPTKSILIIWNRRFPQNPCLTISVYSLVNRFRQTRKEKTPTTTTINIRRDWQEKGFFYSDLYSEMHRLSLLRYTPVSCCSLRVFFLYTITPTVHDDEGEKRVRRTE